MDHQEYLKTVSQALKIAADVEKLPLSAALVAAQEIDTPDHLSSRGDERNHLHKLLGALLVAQRAIASAIEQPPLPFDAQLESVTKE